MKNIALPWLGNIDISKSVPFGLDNSKVQRNCVSVLISVTQPPAAMDSNKGALYFGGRGWESGVNFKK